MKNRLGICLAMAGMLLLGSCAVTDVSQDVDFNQYKTFAFDKAKVSVNNPAYKSGLISSKIRKNVRAEFERHGLQYSKKDPDLLVSYETFTQQKEQGSASGYGYPYGGFGRFYRPFGPFMWGYPYMPYAPMGGQVYQYTEGTLIIDVTDTKTDEHIWRGLVKGNVTDVKALQKSLDKGVKAIMKKYPGSVDPQEKQMEVPKKRTS
jgi:Domain of unknown function (DUF4136)